MASFTLTGLADRYAVGATVGAFPASGWLQSQLPPSGAPQGSATATGSIGSDGSVTLTGLADGTAYYLTETSGTRHYTSFATPAASASGTVSVTGGVDTELPPGLTGDATNGLDVDVTRVQGTVAMTAAAGSQADGHSASIGATADAEVSSGGGSVIAFLRRLRTLLNGGLPAALGGAGGLKVEQQGTASVNPAGETAGVGVGAAADAAATANGSLIGVAKQLRVLLTTIASAIKAEDAAAVDGDFGVPVYAIRNDNNAPLVNNDFDYTLLAVDSAGRPKVVSHHDVTTIGDGNKTVTTAGTRVTLAASTAAKYVTITASAANTGTIVVGGTTVVAAAGTRRGTALLAGDSATFPVDDLNDVNLDSTVNGEGVAFTYVN